MATQPAWEATRAAGGRKETEPEKPRAREANPVLGMGTEGRVEIIHRCSGCIWISWNKGLTMRMLGGCCLCRCWRATIFLRPYDG